MFTPRPDDPPPLLDGFAAEVAAIGAAAVRDRWGPAFVAVGIVHLLIFTVCQLLFWQGDRAPAHFLPLWALDLGISASIVRRVVGRRDGRPRLVLLGVAARVWVTYFILCFTATSLNKLTGMEVEWFKIAWAGLATFGFATMAWLFHLRFLIPAVQMSLTGLLIARFPADAYLIYGASWAIALAGIALALERARGASGEVDRAAAAHGAAEAC